MAVGPDDVGPKMPSGSSLIRAKPDSPPAFLLDCSTNKFWLRQELFTLPCHSWSKTTIFCFFTQTFVAITQITTTVSLRLKN